MQTNLTFDNPAISLPRTTVRHAVGSWSGLLVMLLAVSSIVACSDDGETTDAGETDSGETDQAADISGGEIPNGEVVYSEEREVCADRSALRNAYFGDLHVHTALSFDAYIFSVRNYPDDAYRFAQGEQLMLPPLDQDGVGTTPAQLDRPLDFAAVTDHSEFLAEIDACITPSSAAYDSATCTQYRTAENTAVVRFGGAMAAEEPMRFADICGDEVVDCGTEVVRVWQGIQDAAEDHYDRTSSCEFTSFVAYEWSANPAVTNMHRNVIFRNADVVDVPTSYFDESRVEDMWRELELGCLEAGGDCDVLAIPHNSNWSNGLMFAPQYPGLESDAEQAEFAAFRAQMEPLIEIYQHKADSECINGISGVLGASDELCDFEKWVDSQFRDCGDDIGAGAMAGFGCTSRYDYVRGILAAGIQEQQRLGVNPYRLGIIASTDTHNATAGYVDEENYLGHWGDREDEPEERLSRGALNPGGRIYSGGGLAGVWAEENSRDAIFNAFERREVFGTSGPRIAVRLFGGWTYPDDLCDHANLIELGYRGGTPMGGDLGPRPEPAEPGDGPTFIVSALRDPGTTQRPGTPLQRIQIIKGWIDADGMPNVEVYDVAGDADNGADVDLETCQRSGDGFDSLCSVWTDPDFNADQSAYYYARVVENPTCRWTTWECIRLAAEDWPGFCSAPDLPASIQERAWTSPIWFVPDATE